jgi:FMN-dependent NADH-azoreductase
MKKLVLTQNEIKEVDLTAEEIAQKEKDISDATVKQQEEATAKAQKDADALAGNNKLLELGLTQAQVTAMTGYTPPVSE